MFCQNCGKRVKESWAVCPNCGCKILERDDVVSEERDYHLFGMRRTGRFTFWKIPTIIKVKGDSIHVITHGKKIRKKRFRKQEIEEIDFPILPVWRISDIFRIVIFGIMLLLTMGLSIFAVLFSIKIAVSRHLRIKLASGQVVKIPICQKADASDFLNELDYSTEEIERNNAKKISNKKWMRRERIIYIVLFVIAVITMCLGFQLQMGDIQNEEKPKVKKEIEVKEKNNIDYSGTDMEDFIGQPEKILEGTDFTYNEGDSGYQLLDRDVIVECVDGKVHIIMIADAGELAPSFHGVRVGMSVDEADQLLIDRYKSAGETDNRAYIDLESGISVGLRVNNNSIEEINITQLTEDEIQGYLQENYIFPDSDKKYLSEDEVRNATTEELFIGRNEIFARHGYIFEDEGLRQHFMNTPWYQEVVPGDQFNVDTELNDFEKKNVELIKKIEDEINGVSLDTVQAFSFSEGTYVNDQLIEEMQALVTVNYASADWMEVSFLTMPETNVLTLYGPKIDEKTVQVTEQYTGVSVTLKWDNAQEVTLTSSGEFEGRDGAFFTDLANAHYVLAPGFR